MGVEKGRASSTDFGCEGFNLTPITEVGEDSDHAAHRGKITARPEVPAHLVVFCL